MNKLYLDTKNNSLVRIERECANGDVIVVKIKTKQRYLTHKNNLKTVTLITK